jgi:hypothetical protein
MMPPSSNPDLLMSLGIVAVVIGAIAIVIWQIVAIKKLSMLKLTKRAPSSRIK